MATTPEKKKRATYTTPKGESLFAHLVNVDYGTDQYPDEKGSFNVTLALDADAAAKLDSLIAHEVDTARAEAEEKFDGLKPQTKKKFGSVNFNEGGPEEYDREGYENRQGVKVQRKVPLFDSMQQPVKLSDEPGNGSVIRVAFCCAPYFVEGQGMGGLSLYLNAVQIIRLNTSGERSASDYGFGAEEGGFTSEGMVDDVASTNAAATPDADVPQF